MMPNCGLPNYFLGYLWKKLSRNNGKQDILSSHVEKLAFCISLVPFPARIHCKLSCLTNIRYINKYRIIVQIFVDIDHLLSSLF
ncbi:hypothetical protein EUGRSUZ_G01822 [Eucalyptus grandis]|uniref:Uncharacterized protein n=2 Tax=Eucalyptus grandis TaxID=71139 RepID=A0ACC3K4Z5_EUCGR|nr:hypothetical protein EUGRSUZ_G01822 [Eucalyptus grandis]